MEKLCAMMLGIAMALQLLFSMSKADDHLLLPTDAFNLTILQKLESCRYTVTITTSCSSPEYTRDRIDLAFGDASGHQIYAANLGGSSISKFRRCSSDTYHMKGPCTSAVCYVYLYRSGSDDWIPGSVKIYGYNSFPPQFNFYRSIENGTWSGFNHCATASSASSSLAGLLLYPFLALLATLII
ncbi:embryo-specific protein ATS3B-like [Mercurialis annua]|uniref:embryo-specific protein ATS3B-like n=1 Tax=Mercurialis annua TaxID=3986 RepID=UPI00215DF9E4|nr:embryo-specific protein ATS3B-like [Mercurialis annua]